MNGYIRERIDTPDGDFLDLDWSETGAARLAVVSHGLEGDSQRSYIQGMVRACNLAGWDALAWNMRGCSEEPNRQVGAYHSGRTEDLEAVVQYAFKKYGYEQLALIGFSLGGNLTLKYLGERGTAVDDRICGAVAFSVPCDLQAGAEHLARWSNRLYMKRFLRSLRARVRTKMVLFPGVLDDDGLDDIRTFREFDGRYVAPLHGFSSAEDYWQRCSCKPLLRSITCPTLLINAADDPFLPAACYPEYEADRNNNFFLEIPRYGGHVGFVSFNAQHLYWSEQQATAFLEHTHHSASRKEK